MKKYLPFIIGYTIYASIVLIGIADERGHHFWEPFLGWLVTIPLIVGCIAYFGWKYYKKDYPFDKENDNSTLSDEKLLFLENWSLMNFVEEWGPEMRTGTCTNRKTGEEYKACMFIRKDGTKTYVNFFSRLGELSASEISQRKDELKVGVTKEGKYYLHNGNVKAWEDVDLGL